MSEPIDPELELLLAELAPEPADREVLLEEHRQLEKDLLRLADPLPPADFLANVMSKVAQAPARPVSRADVWSAVGIVAVTLSLAVLALFLSGGFSGGGLGLALASLVVKVREACVAGASALFALWSTAALPTAVAVSLMLGSLAVALRRFVVPVKVVSP